MTIRSYLRIVCAAFTLAAATLANAGLVSQSTRGTHRICQYSRDDPSVAPGDNDRIVVGRAPPDEPNILLVGLGEPCPPFRRVRSPAPVPQIPSSALLLHDHVEKNRRVCEYDHLGQVYRREMEIIRPCPLTPDPAD